MIKTAKKQRTSRGRGRPFELGRSPNPAGRPKGVRNRATVLLEAISDEDLNAIMEKVVSLAKAGDLVATKLILDRVAPVPKSRAFSIALPAIGSWDGKATVLCAYREILAAVARGEASPEEGLQLVALVEAQHIAVKELRPVAMLPEPTPEQLAEQKLFSERMAKVNKKYPMKLLGED